MYTRYYYIPTGVSDPTAIECGPECEHSNEAYAALKRRAKVSDTLGTVVRVHRDGSEEPMLSHVWPAHTRETIKTWLSLCDRLETQPGRLES